MSEEIKSSLDKKLEKKILEKEKKSKRITNFIIVGMIFILVIILTFAVNIINNRNNQKMYEEAYEYYQLGNYKESYLKYKAISGKVDNTVITFEMVRDEYYKEIIGSLTWNIENDTPQYAIETYETLDNEFKNDNQISDLYNTAVNKYRSKIIDEAGW